MATPNEADLRTECCRIGRALAANDWAPGSSGNLSARLDARQFLITPSGAALGELQPDDLLVLPFCDQQSEVSTSGPRPSSELPMHRESYRQRPALKAVIHAHPPYTVALSIIGYDFRRAVVPETILTLGEVGVAPYSLPAAKRTPWQSASWRRNTKQSCSRGMEHSRWAIVCGRRCGAWRRWKGRRKSSTWRSSSAKLKTCQ